MSSLDTIGDILAIKFGGNFALDARHFARIEQFLRRRDITPRDKFKADYHASMNGMGEPIEYPGDAYYENYGLDE